VRVNPRQREMPEREADLQAPLEARDHAISLAGEGALVVAVFEDQPRRSQSSDVVERIVKRGEPRSLFSRRSHFEAAGRSGPGPAVAAEPTATRTASQTTSDPLWRVGGSRRSGLQHPPRPAVPVRRLGRRLAASPSPSPTSRRALLRRRRAGRQARSDHGQRGRRRTDAGRRGALPEARPRT